jgi:hypothetical protein
MSENKKSETSALLPTRAVPGNTGGRVGSSIIYFFDFPSDLLTRAVPSNTAGRVSPLVFVWEKGFLAARAVSGDTGRVWLQEFPSIFFFLFFSLFHCCLGTSDSSTTSETCTIPWKRHKTHLKT